MTILKQLGTPILRIANMHHMHTLIFYKHFKSLVDAYINLYKSVNYIFNHLRCQKMPKINGNEIRMGNILEHNGGLWIAVKIDHVKPGKGGAFAQVEMKNLRNGSKLNERFRSADKVEKVRLEQKDQQFLYENDGMLVFMDNDTFEQIELPSDILGERRPLLQDGMIIQIEYYESEALSASLPTKVVCKVIETEPVVKGQTAANSFKPAVLDNGLRLMVPPIY